MNIPNLLRRHRIFSATAVPAAVVMLLVCGSHPLRAQGPRESYFFNPRTTLSWAQAAVYQRGGSRMTIPFLPVVDASRHAPLGTGDFARDVAADGLLVFAGDGVVKEGARDSYAGRREDYTEGEIDAAGKVVLICYDAPETDEALAREFPLGRRIGLAAARKAAAVVVFSSQKDYPFPTAAFDPAAGTPDLPAIAITRDSALAILDSAGSDGPALWKQWFETKTAPQSQALISRMTIRIAGAFERVETSHFLFRYLPGSFPKARMTELAAMNEKALAFLLDVFREDKGLGWKNLPVTYFRDYDSKLFFTHHWGSGWATPEGTFLVHGGETTGFPLAAHENAHALIGQNWGGSSSFLCEGIGKYAEALASDARKNDRGTIGFIASGRFFRLAEMLGFDIGRPGLETDVGYPAAGSFVGFIVRTYGLAKLKRVYELEAQAENSDDETPWRDAFGKTIREIEAEWLEALAAAYPTDAAVIRAYLGSIK